METVAGAPIDERSYGQPRWVRVEGLHLTLRFLGATPDERQATTWRRPSQRRPRARPRSESRCPAVAPSPIPSGPASCGWASSRARESSWRRSFGASTRSSLHWAGRRRPGRFNAHLTLARTDGVPGADEEGAPADGGGTWARALAGRRGASFSTRACMGRGPSRYEALGEAPLAACLKGRALGSMRGRLAGPPSIAGRLSRPRSSWERRQGTERSHVAGSPGWRSRMVERTRFMLGEDQIPKAWYNISADLPVAAVPAAPSGHPPAPRPRRSRAALPDGADHAGGLDRARHRDPGAGPGAVQAVSGRARSSAPCGSRRRSIPPPTSTTRTRA